jgi:hypothetical protein
MLDGEASCFQVDSVCSLNVGWVEPALSTLHQLPRQHFSNLLNQPCVPNLRQQLHTLTGMNSLAETLTTSD